MVKLFLYREGEHGIVFIPHREVGVPNVVVEIEVQILGKLTATILQQPSAVRSDQSGIQGADIA